MQRPKICLCLTGHTIKEDLLLLETYRPWIDMVELRVDYLTQDERLYVRKFPQLAGLPCILTIRRKTDGGMYEEGEASRTTLFAMGPTSASPMTFTGWMFLRTSFNFIFVMYLFFLILMRSGTFHLFL